ncbi:GTP 3',8-cyclase MoaA [Anaeroselena agilis]|uniref:GTP 3',8-cyclase n=1 Tax=Anaeroselena agilis TaxID=3063788 RepID=A0ABU3NVV5_9FIRM|nr:GTP 3',8-cyclase MoaA [Selenomonadales bacterium 4137-cl]
MNDGHNRAIHYLRVSVTDRCNFRCAYCMPPRGVKWLPRAEILTYEELLRLIAVFSREGIRNVRLTGGEPLVRKGIVGFVAAVKGLGMIEDLSLTTNGSLLPQYAVALKAAGLDRVNISLDTVDPAGFAKVTRCGCVKDTLLGITSALEAGLAPVKINVVLTDALSITDLAFFIDQVKRYPIAVRFIERMPLGGQDDPDSGPDIAAVKRLLEEAGHGRLEPADTKGNGPARYWRLPESQGTFGFITPISEHFCGACNRLRLTADGRLRPCLLSDREIDIRTPLRAGASDADLAALFAAAVRAKPQGHSLCRTSGYIGFGRQMSQIGG